MTAYTPVEPFSRKILGDIEKITLFLDADGEDHAAMGAGLLVLENDDLELRFGEMDAFVVYPHETDDRWNAGWVGGGGLKGLWAEKNGVVIDPWLDERIRSGAIGSLARMEPLPIFYRKRFHDGPLDVLHQQGTIVRPSEQHVLLHARYLDWKDSDAALEARPTRPRTVLSARGVDVLLEHSRWAKAVKAAEQYGIPPTRTRFHAKSLSPPAAAEPARTEIEKRRDEALNAAISMTRKQPLSAKKSALAVALGLAGAAGIIAVFG